MKSMGQRITKLKPVGGFCAETGGAIALFVATALGIPATAFISAVAWWAGRYLL